MSQPALTRILYLEDDGGLARLLQKNLTKHFSTIKSHGRDILVENQPGKGSLFTIVLPREQEKQ